MQTLRVGQHRPAGQVQEVAVPHRKQPHQHRDVGRERPLRKVLVHRPHPGEHLAEALITDGGHQRQARSRAQREATAHPVPQSEDIVRGDAEVGGRGRVGRHRHEVPADGVGAELSSQPVTGGPSVGEGLGGSEALGNHHEQRLGRVEMLTQHRGQRGRVDIGHEAAVQIVMAEGGQCLVGHGQAQVGAPDAQVDHRADGSARRPQTLAGSQRPSQAGHAVALGGDRGHHIRAVCFDGDVGTGPESSVENRPILRCVDGLTRHHGVDPLGHAGSGRERQQQLHGATGHQMPRPVHYQVADGRRQPLGSTGVGREQLSQVDGPQLAGVTFELSPLLRGRDVAAARREVGGSAACAGGVGSSHERRACVGPGPLLALGELYAVTLGRSRQQPADLIGRAGLELRVARDESQKHLLFVRGLLGVEPAVGCPLVVHH